MRDSLQDRSRSGTNVAFTNRMRTTINRRDLTPPTFEQSNADVLRWQSTIRLGAALLASGVEIALSMLEHTAPLPIAAIVIVVLYLAFTGWVRQRVRPNGEASNWLVGATVFSDIVALFGITYLVVPPAHYGRALLLGYAILHLSFSLRKPALSWSALCLMTAGYLAIVAEAMKHSLDSTLTWPQECWSLGLFVVTAAAFVAHDGTFKRRLARIAALFQRAEGGDFSEMYDLEADARPDCITQVGRAYNRVRMQLANLVLTDPLSGCHNRRGLEQQLARELSRAARNGSEIALIALDVDRFKTINDTFGHLAGDAVVQEMGELLRGVARAADVVSRTGGDEFTMLLPDTSAAGAFRVATRIKEEVARREFQGIAGKIPVTVSIGLVTDRVADENIAQDLHSRADEALYAAKDGGRNRVSIWTDNLRVIAVRRAGQQLRRPVFTPGRPIRAIG
ncbi:MAG TPA: GGDEF domain-containing protein [Gemmatimonadaceae bacterium]